ncbi:MAG: hypothetical protein CVU64_14750 [Deltaproteobacteria bacterium HGW-Deltaproteobacteria-21]|nr:MAG: hypothetical protein CVU64_14750 [Deltaproteobacteria bacterium HGW-Deltaproteobacteria-21]
MAWSPQANFLGEKPEKFSLFDVPSHARLKRDVALDLAFLFEFNRDLDRNAQLIRLNEGFFEQRMEKLEVHVPICTNGYEHALARLHELLLICAANYANNCEYAAVGDLMFNPRLTLVHIRGCKEPVVKERHMPLTEQFRYRAQTHAGVASWLKTGTTVRIEKEPLIPHSYGILKNSRLILHGYLDYARARAVQIAQLISSLCCQGFENRMDLETWLRSANEADRALVESSLIPLDWQRFRRLGALVDRALHQMRVNPIFL